MRISLWSCIVCWALQVSAQVRTRKLQTSIRLALVDADSNQEIVDLTDGISIRLADLPSVNLNINAIPGTNSNSVQFDFDGQVNFRSEGVAPYALCGDQGGNFAPCPPPVFSPGTHTLSATTKLNGATVATRTVTFTVVSSASPAGPLPLPTPAPVVPANGLPWVETFSGLPNGAQSDTGATAWSASRATGSFGIQDGALVINNGGAVGVFETAPISISGSTVDVSITVRSQGGLETNQDYVRLFVKVNNGPEQLVGEVNGVQSTVTTISGQGYSGNNIRLVIRSFVSFGDEFYFIDNVSVAQAQVPVPTPVPAPVPAPVPVPIPVAQPPANGPSLGLNGNWQLFGNQNIKGRHEACFVMVDGKGYLMGGRETQDVDIFNPASRTWSKGATAPQLLHHMQCVGLNGKIYLPAAWTGFYPQEQNVNVMWVYDTAANSWSSLPAMPEARRRGSAAVVVDGTKIWVSHGNRGGHEQNNFATSYGWIDYFETATNTWVLGNQNGFPDAPNPRDHTGGALVNGRICVSGGRNGGLDSSWPPVAPTDCFDPVTKTWSVEANIPENRSGSAYGTSCDGKMIVAGGERGISSRVDVFDGQSWQTFSNGLIDSRHGTGLGVDCQRNLIYIASGSPNNGGGTTLSLEVYTP